MRNTLKNKSSERPDSKYLAESKKNRLDFSGAGGWTAHNSRVLVLYVGFQIALLFIYEVLFIRPIDPERLLMLGIPILVIAMMRNLTKDSAKPGLVSIYHAWSSILFLVTAFTIGWVYGGTGESAVIVAFCLTGLAFLVGNSFYFWHWYGLNILGLFGIAWISLGEWYFLPENRPLLFQSFAVLFISAVYCKSRVHEFKEQVDKTFAWADHREELQAAVSSAEESTLRFQKIYEGSFEGIVLHQSGYIYDCNPALLEIFKVSKEEIHNQSILKLLNQEGNSELFNIILTSHNEAIEIESIDRNGQTLYLEALSKTIQTKDGDTVATALRNITARKSAEQSIVAKNKALEKQFNRQKALAEWSSILDNNQDIQTTSGFILKYINDLLPARSGVFFGIRPDKNGAWQVFAAIDGKLKPEVWSSEQNRHYRELAEKICGNHSTVKQAPRKLGVAKRAFAAIPLDLSHGQQGFIMAQDKDFSHYSNQDIDFLLAVGSRFSLWLDNTKMLEDLVVAKELAEAGSRAKSQFLATLSHELRTPLNGIIGSCQVLEPVLDDPEDQATLLAVRNSSETMTNMVDRILSFTQIAGDGVDLKSVEFSIENLLLDIKDSMESLSEAKQLTLDFDIGKNAPTTWQSDFQSCRSIILNLTENALKFTTKGGVRIQVSHTDSTNDSSKTLLFEVSDSGCGFDQEKIEELFQPFSQADGAHSRRHGGLGLGLALCKALTQRLGGQIGAKSTGQGSLFWVMIPEGIPSSGSGGEGTMLEDVFTKIESHSNAVTTPQARDVKEEEPKIFNPDSSLGLEVNFGEQAGSDENKRSQSSSSASCEVKKQIEYRTLIAEGSPLIRMALMKCFEKDGVLADFVKGLDEIVPKCIQSSSEGIVYNEVIVSEKQDVDEISKVKEKLEKLIPSQKTEFKRLSRTKEKETDKNMSGIQLDALEEHIS